MTAKLESLFNYFADTKREFEKKCVIGLLLINKHCVPEEFEFDAHVEAHVYWM